MGDQISEGEGPGLWDCLDRKGSSLSRRPMRSRAFQSEISDVESRMLIGEAHGVLPAPTSHGTNTLRVIQEAQVPTQPSPPPSSPFLLTPRPR